MRLSSAKTGAKAAHPPKGARPSKGARAPKGARASLPALSAQREPSFPRKTTCQRIGPREAGSADVPPALSAQRELHFSERTAFVRRD